MMPGRPLPPPRRALRASHRARIILYIVGILAVASQSDGYTCHVIGLVSTLLALVFYWTEQPKFFRLAMMWCAGFLLIVTPEGLNDGDVIRTAFGMDAYDLASRCLVGSHLAMLLGHDLIFSERHVARPARRLTLRLQVIGPVLVVSTLLALLYFVPLTIQTYRTGRAGSEIASPSVYTAVIQAFGTSAGIGVPIIGVWTARRVRGMSKAMLLGTAVFFLGVQFMLGTRFLLLFTSTGCAVAWTAPRRPSRRILGIILGLGVSLALISSVLSQTRTYGLERADFGEAVKGFSIDSFVMKENVVWSMAQAVQYTDVFGYNYGRSTAEITVFWVPRAVWPNKPTLMGYWLPRAFTGNTGFSEGFSAAPGFTGTTYVDFGLWGCVLFWLIGGLFFGYLERRVAAGCASDGDARVILVAPLFGGAFFAVRSIDTSILVLTGVYIFIGVVLWLGGDRRRG